MTQKVPWKFQQKKLAYGKVPQKFQNSWGGGGVKPGLENTQIKAAFFLEASKEPATYFKIMRFTSKWSAG